MSDAVYPTLPGLAWSVFKMPKWKTLIQASVSGKETRAALQAYPIYKITVTYEFLRSSVAFPELQTLMGFFNLRQGSFDNFLFTDPNDSSVVAQNIGTGTGALTKFQLTRTYGSFTEPVMNVNGTAQIYVNGVLKTAGSDYTIDTLGMVTFATAPISTAAITWTGSYYHRCRFNADEYDFENFMYQLWTLKKVELYGSLGSKI